MGKWGGFFLKTHCLALKFLDAVNYCGWTRWRLSGQVIGIEPGLFLDDKDGICERVKDDGSDSSAEWVSKDVWAPEKFTSLLD